METIKDINAAYLRRFKALLSAGPMFLKHEQLHGEIDAALQKIDALKQQRETALAEASAAEIVRIDKLIIDAQRELSILTGMVYEIAPAQAVSFSEITALTDGYITESAAIGEALKRDAIQALTNARCCIRELLSFDTARLEFMRSINSYGINQPITIISEWPKAQPICEQLDELIREYDNKGE